jgi:hypothetical protein
MADTTMPPIELAERLGAVQDSTGARRVLLALASSSAFAFEKTYKRDDR